MMGRVRLVVGPESSGFIIGGSSFLHAMTAVSPRSDQPSSEVGVDIQCPCNLPHIPQLRDESIMPLSRRGY